jgi:hypothetical protein
MSLRRRVCARKGNVQRGSSSHVVEAREAGLGSRHEPYASPRQQHQSVVGASRRRAAPGSQQWILKHCYASGSTQFIEAFQWHYAGTYERHRASP